MHKRTLRHVMWIHDREIGFLKEKSSRGNLLLLIPYPDYRKQVSGFLDV